MAPASSPDDSNAPASKKQRSTTSPTSFVTWNCNSLPARCREHKKSLKYLKQLVRETHSPDVLMIQEVMCLATSLHQQGQLCEQDREKVEPLFCQGGPFYDYQAVWSLAADKRHHGTLTLLHKRLGLNYQDSENMTAFTMETALDVLLNKYSLTREQVGIPKAKTNTSATHHEHGRFQFFCLQETDIINTYVPNNGNEGKPESYQRRKEWDDDMLKFLQNRQAILEKAGVGSFRKLIWGGDLNVARNYKDGTHWTSSSNNSTTDYDNIVVEEWWTDESKSLYRRPVQNQNRALGNVGHSCFTPAERTRFETILEQGQLIDVWRELHPNGVTTTTTTASSSLSEWERPNYTWRGSVGKNQKVAKYEGRGMRIDYFLTANISMNQVESCKILGYGTQREGLFCGSDHCAVKLQLRE